MNIPTRKECFEMIVEMEMLDNIVSHSIQVCRVSLLLADALARIGSELNRELVRAASLLHDITKTRSFITGERHGDTGDEYLSARGYPEVGDIVRQHVRLRDPVNGGPLTEAEVVHYADKRVLHDGVVCLDERMRYIIQRYARNERHVVIFHEIWEETRLLEHKIFDPLPFGPEDVAELLTRPDAERERLEFMELLENILFGHPAL